MAKKKSEIIEEELYNYIIKDMWNVMFWWKDKKRRDEALRNIKDLIDNYLD